MALRRDTIVHAALRLLDEGGLNCLTLRRLAQELDVQAPALYWHFANKQDLLDAMATQMFAEAIATMPPRSWDNWRVSLAECGRWIHCVLLRYRDGAKVFSGTYLGDTDTLMALDDIIGELASAGFDVTEAIQALLTLYTFVVGFTIEEQAVFPRPDSKDPRYDADRLRKQQHRERPRLTEMSLPLLTENIQEHFEAGLDIVLTGIEVVHQRRLTATPET